MAISQGKSTRLPSGARNVANRGKRKAELGRDPAETRVDEKRMKKEYLELQDELKYIQKLKKSVALSLKDMSTYESKELKQAQSLENIQVQIHQLSGKLDDSMRQYEIGEVNKNYQQVQKKYRQLSLYG